MNSEFLQNFTPDFHSKFAPRNLSRNELGKRIDRLPSDVMIDCGAKLYPLMNLTWGYVETICSLCIQMKIYETKSLIREIRALKRSYDQFRASDMGDKETAQETATGEWLEETFVADFDKLFVGIDMTAKKITKDKNQRLLCVAVQQALTLIDAVKKYAKKCDEKIRECGVWSCDYSMIQTDFLKMHDVLKKFPFAHDKAFISLRDISARILENRLSQCKVEIKETGEIWIEKKVI